jgi:hypothetical protein
VAVLTIIGMVAADYALEVDALSRAEDTPDEPGGPGGKQTVEVETMAMDGYTQEGSTDEIDIGPLPENTTMIKAELTWSDDYGSNDVFRLAIVVNGSESDTTQGSTGSLQLETDEGWYEGDHGVRVTAESCPGVIGIGPDLRDNGNDWSLRVVATVEIEAGV